MWKSIRRKRYDLYEVWLSGRTYKHTSTKKEKSHTVAGLLAIFLGGVGAHKFYLGNILLGILFLIFCWTGVPIIVGIVEGILYLDCPQNQFMQRYGYAKEEK